MTDARIAKWRRWIEGTIESNVLTMHLQRDAWRKVARILEDNGQLPDSYWWEFMLDTYATTQAVAVRRQADLHRDVASLARLVDEIGNDPRLVTRDYWLGLWGSTESDSIERSVAERQWSTSFGGDVGDHLDPEIPSRDAQALQAAAVRVKHYVDKHIAHADASAVSSDVTLMVSDVHESIDTIGDLFRRYYSLLTCIGFASLVPTIQNDWMAVFREPWMQPDQDPPD